MQDGIIKGTGNSRYLKSVANFLSLYPNYEAFAAALIAGELPIDLNGINEAGWQQLATALNKANLLSDETAAALGDVNTPDEALGKLAKGVLVGEGNALTDILGSLITLPSAQLDSSVEIETGSYVGTGTYGSSNPNSLTFGLEPKLVFVAWNEYGLNPNLSGWAASFIAFPGQRYANQNNNHIEISFVERNLSWYSPQNAYAQCNNSSYAYTYIAIGRKESL